MWAMKKLNGAISTKIQGVIHLFYRTGEGVCQILNGQNLSKQVLKLDSKRDHNMETSIRTLAARKVAGEWAQM